MLLCCLLLVGCGAIRKVDPPSRETASGENEAASGIPAKEEAAEEETETPEKGTAEETGPSVEEQAGEEASGEPVETSVCGRLVRYDMEYLDLSDLEIERPEQLEELGMLGQLSRVDLRGKELTRDEMEAISAAYPEITFLFRFSLGDVEADGGMEELDLSGHEIDTDTVRSYLPFLPDLKKLVMCDCGPGDEEMAALREDCPGIKIVWMLHIYCYSLRTDAVAFSTLVGEGEDVQLSDGDVQVLRYCTDLLALDLGHHALTDISFLEDLPDLHVLILAENIIQDISPVAGLTELRYLELFQNYYIESLAPLGSLEKLEDLNLSYVSNARDYESLTGLKKLERLWLNHCGVTYEESLWLEENMPEGCEIHCTDEEASTGGGWRECDKYDAEYKMFRGNYLDEIFQ